MVLESSTDARLCTPSHSRYIDTERRRGASREEITAAVIRRRLAGWYPNEHQTSGLSWLRLFLARDDRMVGSAGGRDFAFRKCKLKSRTRATHYHQRFHIILLPSAAISPTLPLSLSRFSSYSSFPNAAKRNELNPVCGFVGSSHSPKTRNKKISLLCPKFTNYLINREKIILRPRVSKISISDSNKMTQHLLRSNSKTSNQNGCSKLVK